MIDERLLHAIRNAGFRVSDDLLGNPTLWCVECGRDSGMHHPTCSKASEKRASRESVCADLRHVCGRCGFKWPERSAYDEITFANANLRAELAAATRFRFEGPGGVASVIRRPGSDIADVYWRREGASEGFYPVEEIPLSEAIAKARALAGGGG